MEFGKPVCFPEGAIPCVMEDTYYPSHKATDFYHHYKEDIALMAEMGFKMFRMSISWARILPEGEGEVNQKGIEFYKNVFAECHKYGIEPLVTIFCSNLSPTKCGAMEFNNTSQVSLQYSSGRSLTVAFFSPEIFIFLLNCIDSGYHSLADTTPRSNAPQLFCRLLRDLAWEYNLRI